MSAFPCQSDVGGCLLDQMADEAMREEQRTEALGEMVESSYWLRKWHREDDSERTVSTCLELGLLLMLSDGLPCGDNERADGQREDFATRHSILRDCFFAWATAGKPSYLDRYQDADRLAREADDMEDEA